jgi:hypothetical protein
MPIAIVFTIGSALMDARALVAADRSEFLRTHCFDCHSGSDAESGLDLTELASDFGRPDSFARWEQIHDRVSKGEMPPESTTLPTAAERAGFVQSLAQELVTAHAAKKGTVLRRLNRREYQNTLNDLFGTDLDLADMLPEDGRAREFDNIGDSLGLSMVHLQLYMDATARVLDAAIATTSTVPEPKHIETGYQGSREAEQFVGKVWKQLDDGAIVRFEGGGYPSGMIRGSSVRTRGKYRIRVSGYAYQSSEPITFSIGGTSFAPGSDKPIYGFYAFPPGPPSSIELETVIDKNFMVAIEPYGIADPQRYKRKTIEGYEGPGLAILSVTLDGPLVDEFPSLGHRLIFDGIDRREIPPRNPADAKKSWYQPRFEVLSADERADAAQSLRRTAQAAFRRPTEDSDIADYLALFEQERGNWHGV